MPFIKVSNDRMYRWKTGQIYEFKMSIPKSLLKEYKKNNKNKALSKNLSRKDKYDHATKPIPNM